jgi:hypothetical protein
MLARTSSKKQDFQQVCGRQWSLDRDLGFFVSLFASSTRTVGNCALGSFGSNLCHLSRVGLDKIP